MLRLLCFVCFVASDVLILCWIIVFLLRPHTQSLKFCPAPLGVCSVIETTPCALRRIPSHLDMMVVGMVLKRIRSHGRKMIFDTVEPKSYSTPPLLRQCSPILTITIKRSNLTHCTHGQRMIWDAVCLNSWSVIVVGRSVIVVRQTLCKGLQLPARHVIREYWGSKTMIGQKEHSLHCAQHSLCSKCYILHS